MSAQKFVVKKKAKTGGKESKQAQAVKPVIKAEEAAEVKVVIKIPPAKMNICVMGEGVLARVISGCLKSKMRNVFMVSSAEVRRAIRSNGLKIENPKGNIYVDLDVREILDRKVDLVILTSDVDNIKEVIHKNHNFLENTTILATQNSVRTEKIISLALGDKNLISSVATFDAVYAKPNLINYNKEGKWFVGRPFSANDDKVKEICEELSPAFEMVAVDNILSLKWAKMFVNLPNSIPALLGKSLQDTFADLDMSKFAITLLKEGLKTLESSGIKLPSSADFGLDKLLQTIRLPLEEAAKAFSQDMANLGKEPVYGAVLDNIKRNIPSQISSINGEFVHLSRFNSAGANLNAKIVNFVHRVEKTKKFFTIDEIKREFELDKADKILI